MITGINSKARLIQEAFVDHFQDILGRSITAIANNQELGPTLGRPPIPFVSWCQADPWLDIAMNASRLHIRPRCGLSTPAISFAYCLRAQVPGFGCFG